MTRILASDIAKIAGKMKRRPMPAGVSEENCDGSSSQDLARYRGDPAHPRQDHPVAGEGGQPVFRRVGLPRSRP